jgi:hypothetical protein
MRESPTRELQQPSSPAIDAQLAAYNSGDLEAFCDCYAEDVVVQNEETVVANGKAAFRALYEGLFRDWSLRASVTQRTVEGSRTTDFERWERTKRDGSAARMSGSVIVIYQVDDAGKIKNVQFRQKQIDP